MNATKVVRRPADPREVVAQGLLRTRFGVADPSAEDPTLLRRATERIVADVSALSPQALAYARRDVAAADASAQSKADEVYDPWASMARG